MVLSAPGDILADLHLGHEQGVARAVGDARMPYDLSIVNGAPKNGTDCRPGRVDADRGVVGRRHVLLPGRIPPVDQ